MNDATELAGAQDYRELKGMLKALGDVVRLNMMEILAGRDEMTVTDLTQGLLASGRLISQPLVSWHLTILRRWGLVRTRRHGRQVYCTLDIARYQHCLRMLAELVGTQAPGVTNATPPAKQQRDTPNGMLGVQR